MKVQRAFCVYCSRWFDTPDWNVTKAMKRHVQDCAAHPLGAALRRISKLEREVADLRRERRRGG